MPPRHLWDPEARCSDYLDFFYFSKAKIVLSILLSLFRPPVAADATDRDGIHEKCSGLVAPTKNCDFFSPFALANFAWARITDKVYSTLSYCLWQRLNYFLGPSSSNWAHPEFGPARTHTNALQDAPHAHTRHERVFISADHE